MEVQGLLDCKGLNNSSIYRNFFKDQVACFYCCLDHVSSQSHQTSVKFSKTKSIFVLNNPQLFRFSIPIFSPSSLVNPGTLVSLPPREGPSTVSWVAVMASICGGCHLSYTYIHIHIYCIYIISRYIYIYIHMIV